MRGIFRSLILADIGPGGLLEKIPEERWLSSGSLNVDNAPPRPFAVFRYGVTSQGMAAIKRGLVTIWIHDEPGTYTGIDGIIKRLNGILDGVEQVSDGQGGELIRCEWQSNSGDLIDPGFRTITKNTTFNLIGKGV